MAAEPGREAVSAALTHLSLWCRIHRERGLAHHPCSGTCDGHGTGEPCGRPCQCPDHA